MLDVPRYVLEKHGLVIHPTAAYTWVQRKHIHLLSSLMRMEKGVPRQITTAVWVDQFLKQMGMIK